MVNVFGDNTASGPGNLQVVKKVVVTEGKFKDYIAAIQQCYELGFTPYRLHKNVDCTFVTPIRCYDGKVYVLDDVATMEVGDRSLTEETINSKLVDFLKGDGCSGVALQRDRGPSRARGLKGDSGDKGAVGSRGPARKRGVEGPEGPPGKIGKMGPVGSKGGIGPRGEKGDKGDTGGVGQQGPIGPRGGAGTRGAQGAKGLRGVAGIQGPLGVQGPVGQGDCGPKGDKGEIDIVSELCKHLPIAIVEQYHRSADARYAINSMEDIELDGAARVTTIIDKGGRCNASQSDVTGMATLLKTQVNSNYVLDFHYDAYNMEADIHDSLFLCVFGIQNYSLCKNRALGTQLCHQ